ncbi:MAG: endo alpha-1,4 polygalactosaminidase [Actinomycetota bacterium]
MLVAICAGLLVHGCTTIDSDPAPQGRPSPAEAAPIDASGIWTPAVGGRWQYQLQGRQAFAGTGGIDVGICAVPASGGACVRPDVFDIDLFDLDGVTPNTRAVEAIHAAGAHAVCYVDAGSIETYRPDYRTFVRFDRRCGGCLIGEPFSRIFNDENWATLSNRHGQRDFMLRMMGARVRRCAEAGFDGVEYDVVDAYVAGPRTSGWHISPGMQLAYNRSLARIAHRHGLAAGLKNDLGQVEQLLPSFDFAISEQCFQYEECGPLQAFVEAGKPVFHVEYRLAPADFCHEAETMGFSSIVKARNYSLYARPYVPCD